MKFQCSEAVGRSLMVHGDARDSCVIKALQYVSLDSAAADLCSCGLSLFSEMNQP